MQFFLIRLLTSIAEVVNGGGFVYAQAVAYPNTVLIAVDANQGVSDADMQKSRAEASNIHAVKPRPAHGL